MPAPTTPEEVFRRTRLVAPQPVAVAVGRVLRSRTDAERIDNCLKAAEVLTRYLAAAALSSFAAREGAEANGLSMGPLSGSLSFGHFLSLVQRIAAVGDHPLFGYLSPFRRKKKAKGPGAADAALVALLELRNELGHDLVGISEARARILTEDRRPEDRLAEALSALKGILGCPVFVIEEQRVERGQIRGRRLWLMGESRDPEPVEIAMGSGLHEVRAPYLGLGERALLLTPSLIWDVIPARESYGLLFLDKVGEERLRYRSLDPQEIERDSGAVAVLAGLCAGQPRPAEAAVAGDGRALSRAWVEEKIRIEEAARRIEGTMPWNLFDGDTLGWYASRLEPKTSEDPTATIGRVLFDRRDRFNPGEIDQALLLFGKGEEVRKALRREVIDLRAVSTPGARWDDRQLVTENLLSALRAAVEFFARHVGVDSGTLEEMHETSGTADYLAMREALINQFIHQDYADASAAAQVELHSERATFFNTGFSLVATDQLIEGGKSQSRNPLVARALRLVGFAELAGSGIRALQYAWREARRRPPRFDSDRKANSFTLTLDWREVPNAYDDFWRGRIGAHLTEVQAQVLNLATDAAGITVEQVASGTGLSVQEAQQALRFLVHQVLVQETAGRFALADHLREIVAGIGVDGDSGNADGH